MILKISYWMLAGLLPVLSTGVAANGQAPAQQGVPATQTAPATQAAPAAPAAAPLQLNSLGQTTVADPFPPVNLKFFTASTPTVETVNAFLKTLWGYDANRIWRVEAIQKTPAPGVSKVIVFVSEKSPGAKVQTAAFFVTPDGAHAMTPDPAIISFGATPFAANRKLLQERVDGASRGGASKDFMLVEFADLQCPHCKEAQGTMEQLVKDFPNAHVVYQSFPLVDLHPFAFKAAAYGYCVQKQKNDAFFAYAAAVYDTQGALTPETGDETLKNAVTKAGLDPAAVDLCAATQATKDQVSASIKLAEDAGVDQTPMLAVNGRLLPLSGLPYETLKKIVAYQAVMDGVNSGAAAGEGAIERKPPTLGAK